MNETDVLLVTCAALPDGEPGGHLLAEDLACRGIAARWARWDDPDVAWDRTGLVAVRSAWDYESRRAEFLAWAAGVPRLLNGAEVFAWNTDKSYLTVLGEHVPVVPTAVAQDAARLRAAVAAHDEAVVKPCVGAGGRGLQVAVGGALAEEPVPGPWVVQPLVGSVRTEGETSVFVLGGVAVSMARKLPAGGEIRVHEEYGGHTRAAPLTDEAASLAEQAVAAAEGQWGHPLAYARADLVRLADGTLAVGELEATEPGLYLEELPDNAEAFGELVQTLLS
ncbi:MAG: ATP-grasp domain-containing protein [Nocardioidaceae bacterium]